MWNVHSSPPLVPLPLAVPVPANSIQVWSTRSDHFNFIMIIKHALQDWSVRISHAPAFSPSLFSVSFVLHRVIFDTQNSTVHVPSPFRPGNSFPWWIHMYSTPSFRYSTMGQNSPSSPLLFQVISSIPKQWRKNVKNSESVSSGGLNKFQYVTNSSRFRPLSFRLW